LRICFDCGAETICSEEHCHKCGASLTLGKVFPSYRPENIYTAAKFISNRQVPVFAVLLTLLGILALCGGWLSAKIIQGVAAPWLGIAALIAGTIIASLFWAIAWMIIQLKQLQEIVVYIANKNTNKS
jgi:hypothetical protein